MDLLDGTSPPPHPLLRAVAAIHAALDETETLDPDYLPTACKQDYLRQLLRLQHRVQARIMRALAGGADIAEATGSRSAAHWLAHQDASHRGRHVAAQRLGRRIADRYQAVAAALADGHLSPEHARAIVDALDALPASLPGYDTADARDALLAKAEAHLVAEARSLTPAQLRILGRHLVEVLAPETADDIERDLLEAEEAAARRTTTLAFHRLGNGTTRIAARVPDLEAALLRKAIDAHTSPRRPDPAADSGTADAAAGATAGTAAASGAGAGAERLTAAQRRGLALCALLRSLPVDGLPQHGGTPIGIVVTIAETDLRRDTGAASLDTGDRLSVSAARRLACNHGILPAVLGTDSEVLDLGRSRRLFTTAQRKAHLLRHQDCQADGCDTPAAWCEAHHRRKPWQAGGTTDLADLAWLCSFHHHLAHDRGWRVDWSSSGVARFQRRE